MKKTVKLTIILLVVAVIYFGYSAWLDGVAIYAIRGVKNDGKDSFFSLMTSTSAWVNNWKTILIEKLGESSEWGKKVAAFNGSTSWTDWVNAINQSGYKLTGFMAPDSLLYTLLSPFKLILVGGVFAMFIPLLKQLLFNTIIGIKSYLKNRDMNVLFNYSKTIEFVENLKTKISEGDFEGVKTAYSSYSSLAFKPVFLTNLMNEIYKTLIKFGDVTVFKNGCISVLESIQEMYLKEKRRAMNNGRGDEMFYDIKRGFEYSSYSSRYFVKYYEAMSKDFKKLGWKIFSIEISRFSLFLLFALLPSILLSGIISGILLKLITENSSNITALVTIGSFIMLWVIFAIIFHGFYIFFKKDYKINKHILIKPAITYYSLLLLAFMTLTAGCVGIAQVGNIAQPFTAPLMTKWFGALAYLVLTTCLVMYALATLVDNYRSGKQLSVKLIVNNIVLPGFIWTITTGANFVALFAKSEQVMEYSSLISGINTLVMVIFWIYLFTAQFLINNLITSKTAKILKQTKVIQK
ncbi:hypothetical protein V2P57_03600 [Mycoplasma mycoides subsp. mycoides]|uniref:Membrane protein n=1 Tax=Mycoplasma mycoides subsp. mycoides TaxID=2103 RepID=A0AAE2EI54_MYCMY|nr:hypothetical protein [Mycoplasma mycoides]ADK69635.1 putative membrane protein [Mycoplasma mycoides subsp. mycoides SC str. Gladysdale]AIZ55568.1 hypothetical protein mycmycITA_00749 [Mycoplasma mycoides subsp. mycoides]AME10902.1 putative membrane protein [Mycoplasma mycoides subsp. mycoides]AME11913.1 putative membrane protein [Mycoplasma mycoides subsp. mycoides]AME13973.1 putative membrane protein [Mycoplasma mycoides subsp. mycoides]